MLSASNNEELWSFSSKAKSNILRSSSPILSWIQFLIKVKKQTPKTVGLYLGYLFFKVFEKILHNRIVSFKDIFTIIYKNQFEFRENMLTLDSQRSVKASLKELTII